MMKIFLGIVPFVKICCEKETQSSQSAINHRFLFCTGKCLSASIQRLHTIAVELQRMIARLNCLCKMLQLKKTNTVLTYWISRP